MPMRTVLLSLLLMIALPNAGEAREVASVAASVKGTLFDQAGTAVAKVATNHGGLRTTVRNYTSASVFVPAIARGQVDFGVANQFEITLALEGEGYFAGREQSNLRAVAVLFPLQTAMFVRQDSPYQRIADLEDQRLPDGFVANKIAIPLLDALLASDGLTRSDVIAFNVPGLVAGVDAFLAGRTEAFILALRAPKVREADARHGVRVLPIENTPEKLAAIRRHMPVAYLALESPSPGSTGLAGPTWVMTYDTLLFASAETSAETVYQMTRALYANKQNLVDASPAFRGFSEDRMVKDLGTLEYHIGAIRFYTERGLWPSTKQQD
jgi:TRAP transporter TAXI family solute receptor